MTDENSEDSGVYYGVTIPFATKAQASSVMATITSMLGYGGWVRIGDFSEE